ncbi:MAG: hypothetical protein CSA62_15065 [Planctomycetota bacterium]|nr:MAG: hypothetical protein CSA62_15065 [Planctomycetota bacterium]
MASPFDTIFALATPRAPAARAVLRVSGAQAFAFCRSLGDFALARERGLEWGELVLDPAQPEVRASVLFLRFPGPASYTGEDVVELHLLSAPMLLALLEERLVAAGARHAWPGEFTRRAFQNGKLDLLGAEAVRLRIAARSDEELRASQALGTGRGQDEMLEQRVVDLLALLESALDFEELDSAALSRAEWEPELEALAADFARRSQEYGALAARFARPRYLLLGAPNAGKTSLWNALCSKATAGIVADQAGTTRDVRWGECEGAELGDAPGRFEFRGLVEAEENALIERELALCDGYLFVASPDAPDAPEELPEPLLVIESKCDQAGGGRQDTAGERLRVSAQSGEGLDALRDRLRRLGRSAVITLPQASSWAGSGRALGRALGALREGWGEECVATEVREAVAQLPGVDPGALPERLLDRVFARHCLGK